MNQLMSKYLLALMLMFGGMAYSQPSDQQLAKHYFDSGEFEKARLYYEKLYNQQSTAFYYGQYYETLIALKDWKEAEKVVKKQIKRYPNKISYNLDLAEVYTLTDELSKAEHIYEKSIKDVMPVYTSILELGEAFKRKGQLDYALRVFEKGKKSVRNYPFGYKTGEIYGKLGQTELMIEEFLDVLKDFDNYMVSIQNNFVRLLDFDEPEKGNPELLRKALLRRIQKNSDQLIYTEMLIWYFIQIQDFNAAMVQGKALDRRLKDSNGEDVMILSRMCKANKAYDIAIKGYDYVIKEYPNGYHFSNAKLESMGALYDKITTSSYTTEDLKDLETKYESILSESEMGRSRITVPLMMQLAHIEGFYLHDEKKAIALLEEALAIPRISQKNVGACKIAMGDINILSGNVWDASLYYLQVEKMFKQDIIGHEAKYRNAKIYYYTGQFEWAQAQLNVLKASTSKLISNDAMELSLLITDNLGLDSIEQPLMLFSAADLLIFQNKFTQASATLDTLNLMFEDHPLADEILYRRYEIASKQRHWNEAVGHLAAITKQHGDDILGDDATFKQAQIYDYQLKDKAKAKALYKAIIFNYEGSIYSVEARKRFRELVGEEKSDTIKPIILNEEDRQPKEKEAP